MVDEINNMEEFLDPNRVKVVIDKYNSAIILTREPIPSRHKYDKDYIKYKHVAVRAYDIELFKELSSMQIGMLEKIEGIDDLRLIENGIKIKLAFTKRVTETVDTKNDLKKVIKMMENDDLMKKYLNQN